MNNEIIAGIFTIGAGIVTAIVHIFITLQAKKSAEKIFDENKKMLEQHFETDKKINFLNSKKDFLENKVNEIHNLHKEIKKRVESKSEGDAKVDSKTYEVFKFRELLTLIAKSRHYLKDENLSEIGNFEYTLNYLIREREKLIKEGLADDKNEKSILNHKRLVELLNQVEDLINKSSEILEIELKKTVVELEKTITPPNKV